MDGNPKPLSLDNDAETKDADDLVRASGSGGWVRGRLGKHEAPSSSEAKGPFILAKFRDEIGTGLVISPRTTYACPVIVSSKQLGLGCCLLRLSSGQLG
jgi:hypothetical protein